MKLDFVVDLQFGSTGKGLFTGYLAMNSDYDTIFTAWGPNAGHTFVDEDGTKFVHTMLANGVVGGASRILLGPGSVINKDALSREIRNVRNLRPHLDFGVYVHPHAAVLEPEDSEEEKGYGFKIGSTMKGTAAAMIRKLRRDPSIRSTAKDHTFDDGVIVVADSITWDAMVDMTEYGLVEGSQGFSLGVNSGFYPYTTSRECTVQQLMVDCGLPMGYEHTVYGVARTYPIRVANRFDDKGRQIGWSGPSYPGQEELQWGRLNIPTEYTTVTKLPRRIFQFSEHQIRAAIRMNAVEFVFLNFCNYVTEERTKEIVEIIDKYAVPRYLGFGPKISDIKEI